MPRPAARGRLALLGLLIGASACGGEETPATGSRCASRADCLALEICVNGRCEAETAPGGPLDSGVFPRDVGFAPRDAAPNDSGIAPDAGPRADAAPDAAPDAGPDAAVPKDAGPDAGFAPDAGFPTDSGPSPDAGFPSDSGPSPDAGFPTDSGVTPDAGFPPDSGVSPDAGTPSDAGPGDAGFVTPGVYQYRRVLLPGLPSTTALSRVAIAPDGEVMLLSERYRTIHAVDPRTETTTATWRLPQGSGESVLVEAIEWAPGGRYALIAGTMIPRSGDREGRLYRLDRDGGGPVELTALRTPAVSFRAIAIDPVSGDTRVLGHRGDRPPCPMYLYRYDDATRAFAGVDAQVVNAGCSGAAWVEDGLGGRGVAYVCGVNGIALGILDSTGAWANGPGFGAASNTFRIAARPQGDYALTIESGSTTKLSRFEQGVWTTGFSAANLGTIGYLNVAFSDDGQRALVVGNYANGSMRMKEYRHGAYASAELVDVAIGGFDRAPWLGASGVAMDDADWRPGTDCGYAVGGCDSLSCQRGYLVHFQVINGRRCP